MAETPPDPKDVFSIRRLRITEAIQDNGASARYYFAGQLGKELERRIPS
jgi:hypothetical protein